MVFLQTKIDENFLVINMISQNRMVFISSETKSTFEFPAFGTSCDAGFHCKGIFNYQFIYLINQSHIREIELKKSNSKWNLMKTVILIPVLFKYLIRTDFKRDLVADLSFLCPSIRLQIYVQCTVTSQSVTPLLLSFLFFQARVNKHENFHFSLKFCKLQQVRLLKKRLRYQFMLDNFS